VTTTPPDTLNPTEGERRSRGRPARSTTVDTEQLLRQARKIFARHGFDATSVRDIARGAGVDASLMTHYFGSKHALWAAVVKHIAHDAMPLVKATTALAQADLLPRERLERAIGILVDRVFKEPDIGLFFSTAATEHGERVDFLVEHLVRPYHDAMLPLIKGAMDAGVLASNEPEIVYWMLVNAVSRTVAYGHVIDAFSPLPKRPAAFKRAVLQMTLSMLGGQTAEG
jgi:AcrR family transcriptional regulator